MYFMYIMLYNYFMNTKQINIRIDEETKRRLEIASCITGLSRSDIVRKALRVYENSDPELLGKIDTAFRWSLNTESTE